MIELLVRDYIKEEYSMTPYAVNVYLDIGPKAGLLSRLTETEIKRKKDMVKASLIVMEEKAVPKKAAPKKARSSAGEASSAPSSSKKRPEVPAMPAAATARKRLKLASEIIDLNRAYATVEGMENRREVSEDGEEDDEPLAALSRDRRRTAVQEIYDDEDDWAELDENDAENISSSYDGPVWQTRTC